jgi:GntR family transcriptional regulator
MSLDSKSPIPLYFQLKQILIEEIEKGTWNSGDMMPTEHQLQEQYNVSRTTVRQAMQELELEGKIIRYRGRGTFVAKPKVSHSPEHYPTLTDHLLEQGITPGWQVLSSEWQAAPHDIAEQLQIDPGERVFCLRRLRLENTEPIGYHTAYVSPHFADAIDEKHFAEGGSLRYLQNQELLEHSTATRVLEAVPATPEEADLLHVVKGAPMLLIRRVVISPDGQPIEAFRGIYRGDRFEYHIVNMRAISTINA